MSTRVKFTFLLPLISTAIVRCGDDNLSPINNDLNAYYLDSDGGSYVTQLAITPHFHNANSSSNQKKGLVPTNSQRASSHQSIRNQVEHAVIINAVC